MEKGQEVEFKPRETWRIAKNVVFISLAFMMQFTAYNGAANLQSSINAEDGLGTASLAAVYAGLIFSNMFLPAVIIKWLGTKWAMSLAFVTYMPYIAAQLHPRFYTLIPAGLIVGLGGGPLWCSKCTYISVVSETHSKLSNISAEALLVRFLGLFFMIFQINQVWGNLISSLVLSSGDNLAAVTAVNATMIPKLCGGNFLPSADAGEALQQQPPEKIQMITGIYLACMAAAALIVAVGVDSMNRYKTGRSETESGLPGIALLVVTLKLLVEPNQLMMVIINVFVGMQQAFFGADFTAAFISCSIGTGTVGFVMMTYGIADAIGCVVTSYFAKITGRLFLMCIAMVTHCALFIFLLTWHPQSHQAYVVYIIAVIWGLCDSIWMVQVNCKNISFIKGKRVLYDLPDGMRKDNLLYGLRDDIRSTFTYLITRWVKVDLQRSPLLVPLLACLEMSKGEGEVKERGHSLKSILNRLQKEGGYLFVAMLLFFVAYYGILFPGREEAAFSNFRLWESVGYIIAYIISPYLRTSAKTYVLLISMIIGIIFYFIVEYRDRKSRKKLEITPRKYVEGVDNTAYQHKE